jgi:hypothetical protein
MEAKIVPSGVAEVSNLQAKERYAYLKPWLNQEFQQIKKAASAAFLIIA